MCYSGEPWIFTVERTYNINKAEGSCQTNDEAGYDDYRVEIEPHGSLLDVEPDSANPKRKKQRHATIGGRSLKRTHYSLGY